MIPFLLGAWLAVGVCLVLLAARAGILRRPALTPGEAVVVVLLTVCFWPLPNLWVVGTALLSRLRRP